MSGLGQRCERLCALLHNARGGPAAWGCPPQRGAVAATRCCAAIPGDAPLSPGHSKQLNETCGGTPPSTCLSDFAKLWNPTGACGGTEAAPCCTALKALGADCLEAAMDYLGKDPKNAEALQWL